VHEALPRRALAAAAAKQAEQLAFMPLWSHAHPSAIELAARVAGYARGSLNRVFLTSGRIDHALRHI
jgi:adenosylmethionine-8-amino-7-oxononanoate aminotransferase